MSHVYQPLLIRSLLGRGGRATTRDLALDFALGVLGDQDHYEDRIVNQPLPVLESHGVVRTLGDQVHLNLDACSPQDTEQIRLLCCVKIFEFLQKKGVDSWNELRNQSEL